MPLVSLPVMGWPPRKRAVFLNAPCAAARQIAALVLPESVTRALGFAADGNGGQGVNCGADGQRDIDEVGAADCFGNIFCGFFHGFAHARCGQHVRAIKPYHFDMREFSAHG